MSWIKDLKGILLERAEEGGFTNGREAGDKHETLQQRISANIAKIKAHKGPRTTEIENLRVKTMKMITKGRAMGEGPPKERRSRRRHRDDD